MLMNYKEEMNQATSNRILLNNGHKLVFEHNPLDKEIQRGTAGRATQEGVEHVEAYLQQQVQKKQIRVKEFFTDYDVLRKGLVQEDKFRSALAMMFNCHIQQGQIVQLMEKYRAHTDLIDYQAFVNKMHQQPSPQSQGTTRSEMHARVRQLLEGMHQVIKTKRILIKQPFQDYDRTKSSHISRNQFVRVLNQLGLLPKSESLLELLLSHYENPVDKQVNYVRFCEDVDHIQNVQLSTKTSMKLVSQSQVIQDVAGLDLLGTLFVSRTLPPLEQVAQIEQKIRAECFMKQLRIKEFFLDYDNLRKGVVTKFQLKRILNINNLRLSDQEIGIIIDKYAINDDQVDYYSFIENIDRVFTTKGIEKDPLYSVEQKSKTTTIPARRHYLDMSAPEDAQLAALLETYRHKIQNTRVLMKPHFQDFDRQKGGYISKNQFLRILHQFSMMPEEQQLNLLLRKYIDRGNLDEVNYAEFCKDVEVQDEGHRISQNYFQEFEQLKDHATEAQLLNHTPSAAPAFAFSPADFTALLARLTTKVKENRIRVEEFLKDFDKLRTGMISKQQFRVGLNMCQLDLSEKEFYILNNSYQSPLHDKILWKQFVQALEGEVQGTQERLAQPENDAAVADRLKRQINAFIKRQRIELKKFFKDWDRQNRNRVSAKQFRQVLATIKFNMSDYEAACITDKYLTKDGKDVNYQLFIQDCLGEQILDQQIVDRQIEQEGLRQREANIRAIQVPLVDQTVLLNWLKTQIKMNNIRIEEYFRDFDPLRKGTVPLNKFRGILSLMKIDLHEDQLKTLESVYRYDQDDSKINYFAFVQDINVVFSHSGLEKNPDTTIQNWQPPQFLDPRTILDPAQQQAFHALMQRLGECVRKHRILLLPHFQDKDKAVSGKVSFSRFRMILDFHKLPLNEQQYQLMAKRFSYEGVEFNYLEFIDVLKKYENM